MDVDKVFDASNSNNTITSGYQTFLRVAAGPDGAIAVGVLAPCLSVPCPVPAEADFDGFGPLSWTVVGLFWSKSPSITPNSWITIPAPGGPGSTWGQTLNNINQAAFNFAVAIDPTKSNLVYVSGDEGPAPMPGQPGPLPVYRIDASTGQSTPITGTGYTQDGSDAHTDSRTIAFNSDGQLLLGSDGGYYVQTSPQISSGVWLQDRNTFQAGEGYAIAYGANARRLMFARQDNGVSRQSAPNSGIYYPVLGADGHTAVVNDMMFSNSSVFYVASKFGTNGSLSRLTIDSQGTAVPAGVTCNGQSCVTESTFGTTGATVSFVLNRSSASQSPGVSSIAIAGQNVYVTQDTTGPMVTCVEPTTCIDLTLIEVGTTSGNVTALAYGTNDPNQPNAVLAGGAAGLFLSTTGQANSLNQVSAYPGATPIWGLCSIRDRPNAFTSSTGLSFGARMTRVPRS
jgi:hypothetical protein